METYCRCSTNILKCADVIIISFVILPSIILYWSGTWKLLDIFVLPGHETTSSILSLLVGEFITLCTYYILPILGEFVLDNNQELDYTKHIPISRIFIYINTLGIILLWRGVWDFTEAAFGKQFETSVIISVVSILWLILNKGFINVVSPPYLVLTDNRPDFYSVYPRYRTQSSTLLYFILDVLFTACLLQTVVVSTWAGIWNCLDEFLYPRKMYSYLFCIGIGYCGFWMIAALQKPTQKLTAWLHEQNKYLELIYCDTFILVVLILNVIIWKGTWGYIKDFILVPEVLDDHPWLPLLFHGVGIFLLIFLQTGTSLSAVGCGVDCEVTVNGAATRLPLDYLVVLCNRNNVHLPENQSIQVANEDENQSLLGDSPVRGPVYGGL